MGAYAYAAGVAMQMAGSISAGNQSAAALRRAAEVQRTDAQQAIDAGEMDAARQGMIADQKIGTSMAAYGASGVTESGSVMHVFEASHRNAEMDAMQIKYGARIKAVNYLNQSSMDEIAAGNAQVAGYLNAFGSALSGAGKGAKAGGGGGGGDSAGGEGAADAAGAVA